MQKIIQFVHRVPLIKWLILAVIFLFLAAFHLWRNLRVAQRRARIDRRIRRTRWEYAHKVAHIDKENKEIITATRIEAKKRDKELLRERHKILVASAQTKDLSRLVNDVFKK